MNILHQDDHVLVVDKPPGLLAQADHTGAPDVVSLGKQRVADGADDDPFLGLVHRLDRPASGIMVLGRTSEAARHLSRQFRERLVEKRYLVMVEGMLRGIGTWTDYIAKPDRQPRLVDPGHADGKRAVLDWQVLASEDDRTLLQVELGTGRPHQIRLQATRRGHPVMGDQRYGAASSLETRAIALHHALLRFDHPARSARQTVAAAPPEHWAAILSDDMRAALRRMLDQARPH
ncbi:MAG: RluA family pseudouridine synthase [Bacteroidetes bacterium QS_1_63_11]|nr:MAG: RluA family pseudouridine synthase [Bacteroidetes bacterium QS_1_63_11]